MRFEKPSIVLIPGAWHTAACYRSLTQPLESAGYSVQGLTLPSVGAEPPVQSLDPEIHHIRQAILPLLDEGRDVVVVMHSYGGVAGSSSMEGLSKSRRQAAGLKGGVVALVYLCAWIPEPGQDIRSAGGGAGGKGGASKVQVDGDYIHHLDPVFAFYNDMPTAQAEEYAAEIKHHSFPTLKAPNRFAAWKEIPSTYLLCRNDNTIPYERQVKLVQDANLSIGDRAVKITSFECDAGHSPFASIPDLTAKVIRHAAGEPNIVVS